MNSKKFVFPSFEFDYLETKYLFQEATFLGSCGNLKKSHKITFQITHPGNNTQNLSHGLVIFHETTSAAILSYNPERVHTPYLQLFNKLFLVCNSKQHYHSSNKLGNAVVSSDQKPEFLLAVADWVELWSTSPSFTLSKQTSKAIITSLKAQSTLIQDLLNEGYQYILSSRFQSDPLERHFGIYRQMNRRNFLVSLRQVLLLLLLLLFIDIPDSSHN